MSILNVKYFDYLFDTKSQTKSSQSKESEIRAMMAIFGDVVSNVKESAKEQEVSDIGGSL